MKNTLIIILTISTLVLAFLQIRSCETTPNLTEQVKVFQNEREKLFDSSVGAPIDSFKAIALTDSFIRYCVVNLGKNPDFLEKSVYFHSQDIDSLLANPCHTGSQQKGIRAYFGKYPEKLKDSTGNLHPFAGRFTVILRATCDIDDISYLDARKPAYDFGDVCPPNCSPEPYFKLNSTMRSRSDSDLINGKSSIKTIKGGNFKGNGKIPRI